MGPTVVFPDTVKTPVSTDASDAQTQSEISTVVIENDVPEAHGRHTPDYKTEYADIACRLKAADFTDQDVAYALGVSLGTIASWKRRYDSFKRACEEGRREQKKRIVARAMKQALGYRFKETNTKLSYDKDGNVTRREESTFEKENPGNERLLVFLLTNIDRQLGDDEWKSVSKVEVDESQHVKIVVDGKAAQEQIQRLAGELSSE